jgi:hypothetical protein
LGTGVFFAMSGGVVSVWLPLSSSSFALMASGSSASFSCSSFGLCFGFVVFAGHAPSGAFDQKSFSREKKIG